MLRNTQTGRLAHTPAENAFPPDVAAFLEDVDRRHRENYAYQLVYRIRGERDYSAWPSSDEVALRLGGKFPGGIQLQLPLAEHVVATVKNRPPEKQPSRHGKIRWRQRNGRKGARVRWAPTAVSRSERDDAIIAARAGGQSRADVAAE